MSTAKRERQRRNRELRIAAEQEAARKAASARRIKRYSVAAVVAVLVLGGIALFQALTTDDGEAENPVAADDEAPQQAGGDTPSDAPDEALPDPVETAAADPEGGEDHQAPAGCPEPDGSSGRVIDFDAPQPDCIDLSAGYAAVFDTSEGEMRFDLHAASVPSTVNNFVTLARWGYYDETLLFRTDPSIDIIQGGSPHTNSASDPGPGYTITDEPAFEIDPGTGQLTGPYRYEPGQLVMARSAGPDSASAQFFITTGPNAALLDSQGTYVVFGTTDQAGLAVAQSIIGLHTDTGMLGGQPSRDVTVHSVTIEETLAS